MPLAAFLERLDLVLHQEVTSGYPPLADGSRVNLHRASEKLLLARQ